MEDSNVVSGSHPRYFRFFVDILNIFSIGFFIIRTRVIESHIINNLLKRRSLRKLVTGWWGKCIQ